MAATADDYEIRVEVHYGDYTALVREFPSLSWIAESEDAAREGMRDLLDEVLEDMRESNEPIPAPGARPSTAQPPTAKDREILASWRARKDRA